MEIILEQLNTEINKLVTACYGKSYKNRDSLLQLQKAFERLRSIRKEIILRFHHFPGDLSVGVIIEDISKLHVSGKDKKMLEWNFDHYNDLFKFKAEDLQSDIYKLVATSQAAQN